MKVNVATLGHKVQRPPTNRKIRLSINIESTFPLDSLLPGDNSRFDGGELTPTATTQELVDYLVSQANDGYGEPEGNSFLWFLLDEFNLVTPKTADLYQIDVEIIEPSPVPKTRAKKEPAKT